MVIYVHVGGSVVSRDAFIAERMDIERGRRAHAILDAI
jgi:hypothetical protein